MNGEMMNGDSSEDQAAEVGRANPSRSHTSREPVNFSLTTERYLGTNHLDIEKLGHKVGFKGGRSRQSINKKPKVTTALTKSIKNNIQMYFKRDFMKLKSNKDSLPVSKKLLSEKKPVDLLDKSSEKRFHQQSTTRNQTEMQSNSMNRNVGKSTSTSKRIRALGSKDRMIER